MRIDRLKSARERAKLTQEELAERVNISLRSYVTYESGDVIPRSDVLSSLASVLGVSTDYLLGVTPMTEDSLTPDEKRLILAVRNGLTLEALQTFLELSKRDDPDHVDAAPVVRE